MKPLFQGIVILCLLCTSIAAYAEEISNTFMREHENGTIIYIDKKTSAQRSTLSFFMKKTVQDNRAFYTYTAHGKGDYDEYKDVSWDIESEMEEKGDFLYPVYSINSIKDKNGIITALHKKLFDYDKQKIYYTVSDSKGAIVKNYTFPMKGMTVDSATLIHFLKTFAAHRTDSSYKVFYIISDKGQLYKINIQDMGLETLELPSFNAKTIKLRLVPDLGLFTGIVKSIIPPTFVWYSDSSPYEWLQYEGLETGIGSTHIIAYIYNREIE